MQANQAAFGEEGVTLQRPNTTRCETNTAIISSLNREPDVTLAEPAEIRPQNLSPCSAPLNPPEPPTTVAYCISIVIGLTVELLELHGKRCNDRR
jgi:hypothetical protein